MPICANTAKDFVLPAQNGTRRVPPQPFMPEFQFPRPPAATGAEGGDSTLDESTLADELLSNLTLEDEEKEQALDDDTDTGDRDDSVPADSPLAILNQACADGGGPIPAAGSARTAAAGEAEGPEFDTLAANLADLGADNGIFEVTMPGGQKLGVAVTTQGAGVRFLMNSDDRDMIDRLKNCRVELQGAVERRIRRNVEIAVL
jgi:hypothetical protein